MMVRAIHGVERIRMLKKIARRLLPGSIYNFGKRWVDRYQKFEQQRLPILSETEFRRILSDELGVREGGVVFVHSSLERINLGFPFFRILFILRELVGEKGTLLFPATQLTERPEDWLGRGELFDVKRSPTTMGIIPEFARRQKEAVRSLHPTSSVVAIGRLARELTENHADSIYPCGAESPYYRIVDHDGIIIGIGVDTDVLTFAHCVEDNWGERFPVETRCREIYEGRVRDADGNERGVKTLVAHRLIRWRRISRYMRRYVPEEVCRSVRTGGVDYYAANARKLYEKMEELTDREITIYTRLVHKRNLFVGVMSWLSKFAK